MERAARRLPLRLNFKHKMLPLEAARPESNETLENESDTAPTAAGVGPAGRADIHPCSPPPPATALCRNHMTYYSYRNMLQLPGYQPAKSADEHGQPAPNAAQCRQYLLPFRPH